MDEKRVLTKHNIAVSMALLSWLVWDLDKEDRDAGFEMLKRIHKRLSERLIGIIQLECNATAKAAEMLQQRKVG